MQEKHKTRLFGGIVATMMVLLVGAILEIGARLSDLVRGYTHNAHYENQVLYAPHPTAGYALSRNLLIRGRKTITTNSAGFRGTREYEKRRPPDHFRILGLGGSSTFGHGVVTDADMWPAQLEQILNRQCGGRWKYLM